MVGQISECLCSPLTHLIVYGPYTNSAIAASTVLRSLVGGGFPLFTPAMVNNLGYSVCPAIAFHFQHLIFGLGNLGDVPPSMSSIRFHVHTSDILQIWETDTC